MLAVGDLRVDPQKRRCWRGPSEIVLTARELDLLVALARREGGAATKAELLAEVWGFDFDGDDNIVEVYVRYLRTKIDRPFARNSMQTVRTIGYRLVDDRPLERRASDRRLGRARGVPWIGRGYAGSVRLRVTVLAAGAFAIVLALAAFILLRVLEGALVDDVQSANEEALELQATRGSSRPAGCPRAPRWC